MSVNCKHFLSIQFNMRFGAQKNRLNETVPTAFVMVEKSEQIYWIRSMK